MNKPAPASFKNLAFDTGVIAGRLEMKKEILELLEKIKADCYCKDCKPHAERNNQYLTALQDLIEYNYS